MLNQFFGTGHSRQHNYQKLVEIRLEETQQLKSVLLCEINIEDRKVELFVIDSFHGIL